MPAWCEVGTAPEQVYGIVFRECATADDVGGQDSVLEQCLCSRDCDGGCY